MGLVNSCCRIDCDWCETRADTEGGLTTQEVIKRVARLCWHRPYPTLWFCSKKCIEMWLLTRLKEEKNLDTKLQESAVRLYLDKLEKLKTTLE